jgi:hypothetical protein
MLPVPSATDMLEFELVRYVWGKFVQKSPGLALERLKWRVRHQSLVDEQAVESVYRKTELYQGHQDLYRYIGELTILELREVVPVCGLESRIGQGNESSFKTVSERLDTVKKSYGWRLSVAEFSQVARRIKKPI